VATSGSSGGVVGASASAPASSADAAAPGAAAAAVTDIDDDTDVEELIEDLTPEDDSDDEDGPLDTWSVFENFPPHLADVWTVVEPTDTPQNMINVGDTLIAHRFSTGWEVGKIEQHEGDAYFANYDTEVCLLPHQLESTRYGEDKLWVIVRRREPKEVQRKRKRGIPNDAGAITSTGAAPASTTGVIAAPKATSNGKQPATAAAAVEIAAPKASSNGKQRVSAAAFALAAELSERECAYHSTSGQKCAVIHGTYFSGDPMTAVCADTKLCTGCEETGENTYVHHCCFTAKYPDKAEGVRSTARFCPRCAVNL
jgi:hypothetical protein